MFFELKIFLYIFYAFLVLWGILSLSGIFHMLKYGFKNFTTFFVTTTFIVVSFLMLSISFTNIRKINWNEEVSLFAGFKQSQEDLFQIQ